MTFTIPQMIAAFLLAFPVLAWPATLVAQKRKATTEWIGKYLSICTNSAGWAALLYYGGFWH